MNPSVTALDDQSGRRTPERFAPSPGTSRRCDRRSNNARYCTTTSPHAGKRLDPVSPATSVIVTEHRRRCWTGLNFRCSTEDDGGACDGRISNVHTSAPAASNPDPQVELIPVATSASGPRRLLLTPVGPPTCWLLAAVNGRAPSRASGPYARPGRTGRRDEPRRWSEAMKRSHQSPVSAPAAHR